MGAVTNLTITTELLLQPRGDRELEAAIENLVITRNCGRLPVSSERKQVKDSELSARKGCRISC